LSEPQPSIITENFSNAIDICLSRWDELNAIRGLYMCENAMIEWHLRETLNEFNEEVSYRRLFNNFKRTKIHRNNANQNKGLLEEWDELIKYRNLLAHTTEGYDEIEGYYIKSTNTNLEELIIYESELDKHRIKLNELKQKILLLILSPNKKITLLIETETAKTS
jgi:hypothetical protein